MPGKITDFWNYLRGSEDDFGMEAQIFHSISIITLGILLVMAIINFIISLHLLAFAAGIAVLLQFLLFYLSRFRGQLKMAILGYGVISYLLLIGNFFYNSGHAGPTFFGFFLTLLLLITISQEKYHLLWLLMHSVVMICLLLSEYFYPEWVPYTYLSASDHFLDLGTTCLASLVFIFLVTSHLRSKYIGEKWRAEERAVDLLRQNEHLALLDKERNKLFSIISHDLRGPLGNIESLLMIQDSVTLTEEEKVFVKRELLKSTINTREMLENLLTWSKAQRGDFSITPELLPFNGIMEEVASLFTTSVKQKNIFFEEKIEPGLQVFTNSNYLKTILRNLIGNALKFTPAGGSVTVAAETNGKEVLVSIRDTGTGIPQQVQPLLFTPDVYSSAGTGKERGAGLGLLICKDLVEKQRGRIWFESAEGKGTTFFFTLQNPPGSPGAH